MKITKEMLSLKWGEFKGIDELSASALQDGRFSVELDSGRFECLLARKSEKRLFVLLAGARDPERQELPKFDRWSWTEKFPGSVLCISDPTLYLDPKGLHIGWYVGNAEHDWLKAMAEIVKHLATCLGVSLQNVIAYGSSAGGFGALTLAAELGNATAVAINPQTNITQYASRYVTQFLNVAFHGRQIKDLSDVELRRFSAIAAFKSAGRAKCLLVQNVQDMVHFKRHFTPFCKEFGVPLHTGGVDSTGRIMVQTFDTPNGHGPEPREMVVELIRKGVALSELVVTPKIKVERDVQQVEDLGKSNSSCPISARQIYLLTKDNKSLTRWDGGPVPFVPVGRSDLAEHVLSLPIEWNADPFQDRNWRGQLHMWRMMDPYLIRYESTQDPSWLDLPLEIIRDWHFFHHVAGRKSEYAWKDMMVGLRAMKLAYVISHVRHRKLNIDVKTKEALSDLTKSHLEFLLDHANIAYSNHTFFDIHGAAALAQIVDERIHDEIYITINEVLPKLISTQFDLNGIHLENSPEYHPFGTKCLKRLQESGWFDASLDKVIARAEDIFDWFKMPDGRIVPIGDSNGNKQDISKIETSFRGRRQVLNLSGYVVLRDDGGGKVSSSSYLAMMGALNSRFHKQSDDLSLVWFEGEDILCDAGKYAYKTDNFRAYAVSTRAHNTIEIDGQDYYTGNRISSEQIYGSAIGTVAVHEWGYLIDATVHHSKFGVEHSRFVLYRPGSWLLVIDRLLGESKHQFTQWFHFASHLSDLELRKNSGYHSELRSGRKLKVASLGGIMGVIQKGVKEPRLQGWVSEEYRQMTANCALGFEQEGKDVLFATLITLDEKSSTIKTKDSRAITLEINTADRADKLRISIGERSCRVKSL